LGHGIFFLLQFVMLKIYGISIGYNQKRSIPNTAFTYHRF
jgi:hypothetical protein